MRNLRIRNSRILILGTIFILLLLPCFGALTSHVEGAGESIFGSITTQVKQLASSPYLTGSAIPGATPFAPTLGNYSNTTVQLGANSTITPDAQPVGATRINVSSSPRFKGKLTADPATGVIRITNARPAGTHTLTVRAFDSLGATTTTTLTLTVTTPPACVALSFAPASNFSAGTSANGVAIGDFNNDGNQDFAVASQTSRDVTVWLGNGTGGFTSGATFSTGGGNAFSIAIGDLNNDGNQDIVASNTNTTATSIAILIGNGLGNFTLTNVATGSGATQALIGDFNNDGKPDIVVSSNTSHNVTLLLGNGAGGFSSGGTFAVNTVPNGMAIGDFNGDNNLDLVTTSGNTNNLSILIGNGAGSFAPFASVPVGRTTSKVATGDFNSDNFQDIAYSTFSTVMGILLNNGAGGFTSAASFTGSLTNGIDAGDINSDGNQDVAFVNSGGGSVAITRGNGAGSFSTFTTLSSPSFTTWVAIGDFNNDGRQDLVSCNSITLNASVFLSNCTTNAPPPNTAPTFLNVTNQTRTEGSPVSNSQIATVSDAQQAANTLTVAVNDSTSATVDGVTVSNITIDSAGAVSANVVAACGATNASFTLKVTDSGGLNNSATLNVTVNPNTPPVLTYSNQSVGFNGSLTVSPSFASDNGSITYTIESVTPPLATAPTVNSVGIVSITSAQPSGSHAITVRATDNCGEITDSSFTLDVAANPPSLGNYANATVNLSGNTQVTPDAVPANATSVSVSASTGFKGILTANLITGVVRVVNAYPAGTHTVSVKSFGAGGMTSRTFVLMVNVGTPCVGPTPFISAPNVPVDPFPNGLAVGDFNEDGHQDFVNGYDSFSPASVRFGNGAGGFTGTTTVNAEPFVRSIAVGDFNEDGHQDLALSNNSGPRSVSIRLGDGAGNFSGTTNVLTGNIPTSVAIGDFNNDGHQDFATANEIDNTVSVRFGDGTGNFTGTTEISVAIGPESIAIGDFNNDGNQDFATASFDGNSVSIRLGNGLGGFTSMPDVPLPISSFCVVIGDFNGDNKQDIAASGFNQVANLVSVRLGDGAGNFAGTTDVAVSAGPQSMVTGDFNNDGNQDFATANINFGTISMRFGDGAGNFSGATATSEISVSQNPIKLALGDFNGDGKQDFVTIDFNSPAIASIRLNNSCPAPNISPTIVAAGPLTRQQDAAAINSQIATVNDADQTEDSLTVTATPLTGTGVTVTNISVAANGTVTANVAAACAATNSTFTLTVTDALNEMATATLTVNVTPETTPPTLTCPANIIQSNGAGQCSAVVNYTTPTASDNCAGATVTCNPASGTTFPKGTTTVTCTATDAVGNSANCSFTVTINDIESPTIACLSPITQSTDENQCSAVVSYETPTASDNCEGVGAVTCSPASGSTFPKGITTVNCNVSDAAGNNGSCSFTVTVNDIQPPALTCPANITKASDPNQCSAVVNYTNATATDNCPGVGVVTCSPASGSTFPKGVTTITCTATDASGNNGSCSFTVTVNDTQAPTIACLSPITQSTDANQCSAAVNYTTPSASDNCEGVGAVTCSPASGSTFPKGVTTVMCTVSDASGNNGSCSFTVTVNDTQAPTIACLSPITQGTDMNQCSAVVSYTTPSASDNCSGVGVVTCSPASGSTFPKGVTTVMCSATDASGNNGSCSFTVTVNDAQAPQVTCPANITRANDPGQCSAIVTYANATATDNCPGVGAVTCSPASGSTFPKGITTVNCNVSDAAGNNGSCSFIVTVNDTQAPSMTCPANIVRPNDGGQCAAIVNYLPPAATDNCPGVGAVTCAPASGSTFPKGVTTVTCSVSDASSNNNSCSFTITVNDTEAPTVQCPANISTSTTAGQCSAVVSFSAAGGDNCSGVTVSCSPASGSTFPKGTTTVSCRATDASGNQSTNCAFTVTVNDTQNPTISCPSNITKSTDPNLCSAVVNYSAPAVSDNCPGVGAPVCNPPSGTAFPKGTTTVICQVNDASGNQSGCSFIVTINDTQAPTLVCPPSQVAALARPADTTVVVNYPSPTYSDNCPGASVVCNPPSGSAFPVGLSTVTCTATDTSGNQSSCSFIVTTFNICLQDDSNSAIVVLFNSQTGDYLFCVNGSTWTGRGAVLRQGNIYTLTHNTSGRRVMARYDGSQNKGTGSLQSPVGTIVGSISDRDTRNNTCSCTSN